MNINKVIVHYLSKSEGEQRANVQLSENFLPVDDLSIQLIQTLNNSYKKSGITYAIFDLTNNHTFPDRFNAYIASNTDDEFLMFSRETVINLRDIVQNISPAKGGFLVFAEYEIEERTYIAVFLIRDTIGMLFRRNSSDSSFIIDPTEHLDLEKLAMACRVNLNRYSDNDGRYLSFIKKKMNDISEYFINWIAAINKENNQTFTKDLYQLTNLADCPFDDDGNRISRDIFRKQIFDFISSSPTKTVNIHQLSDHFYGEENYLIDFAEGQNIVINTEFQADNQVMKKFVRIDLESDGIYIRFSRGEMNSKVRFSENSDDVVIIESSQFANALRQEWNENE